MCGIIGYIGSKPATPILVEGLRRLEYRGYDSAGIAVIEEDAVSRVRMPGKVERLAARIAQQHVAGSRIERVPEAGHSLYWELPELFNARVDAFFDEVLLQA